MVKKKKNLPAMQETQVRSLGREDPLEKGMATHSRILAWRIAWTEEPGRLQSMGLQSQIISRYYYQPCFPDGAGRRGITCPRV